MIVPMKKATILCETKDAGATITRLRTLGVLHVEHQNLPEGGDITALQENRALITSSLDVVNQIIPSGKNFPGQDTIRGDWIVLVHRIIELGKQQEQLETASRMSLGHIREWERWGDIDQNQVRHLAKNGIYLKLYQIPVKETGSLPDDVFVRTLFTAGDIAHCVVISRRQITLGYPEIIPPTETVSSLKSGIAGNSKAIETIKDEIITSAAFYEDLLATRKKLEKTIELLQVLNGMGREGAISYVTGYIPAEMESLLADEARINKWGILVTEPSADDYVPTLLRNPRWVGMIRPVLGLLGLTAGYRELDVSALFLVFFSIFFGILIGDAGYGLVYIAITFVIMLWLHKKMQLNAEMKTILSLFYLLGSCAVIWGVLTGTFFGQGWLQPLVPQLNNAVFMTTFCFFLGAFHLSIAHTWRAYLKFPSLTALSDVGWICVLWSAFFLARTLILGEPFPLPGLWLVATGVLLVIVFTSPQARVLRGIGEGLGTVLLSFMNNITDVISYIRLFAVGLATLAIAETTNFLASGLFGEGVTALVAGIAILIIGHTLNIILGPMSVLVHGVRLNVLEFSGHANVTWSGTAFEPLKE
jgi:V/A-type H+/Na+-transporting ATPase subunit I